LVVGGDVPDVTEALVAQEQRHGVVVIVKALEVGDGMRELLGNGEHPELVVGEEELPAGDGERVRLVG
jgi:hypothetical protein